MADLLKQRWARMLVTAIVAGGLYVAAGKFPAEAAKLGALATAVAALLPSALGGGKDDEAKP